MPIDARTLQSLREPQLEPSEHCWMLLQDHGPADGGWGPAAVVLPGTDSPLPLVYTGKDEHTIARFLEIASSLARRTGKPTRLVRYTVREDVFAVGGAS